MGQYNPKKCLSLLPLGLLLASLPGCGGGGEGGAGGDSRPITRCVGTGTAMLSWVPPNTSENGTPVDLAEFRIYAGPSPSDLAWVRTIPATETELQVNGLCAGTWYVGITAVSTQWAESRLSNIENKTIVQ